MLQSPADTRAAKKALARTYDHASYRNPWAVVEDYRKVQQAPARYLKKGAGTLSVKTDIPRSRLQP